jgi:peptide/nickel transport system ATP-binding protein
VTAPFAPTLAPIDVAPAALAVAGLGCSIATPRGDAELLRDVGFTLARGRTLGIVGESGAGKSMLIKAVLGIAPRAARVTGAVQLAGTRLDTLPERERRRQIGRRVGIVFQNPMTSLNPFVRVGRQLSEASRLHLKLTERQARSLVVDLIASVGIADAAACYDQFPHQFSGGMKQRLMIAAALTCEPDLLIADEATTALDVTVQKEILDLLQRIQRERGMAMILVTHDLGIVAGRTDEVAVMYAGRIVECGPTVAVFRPRHRYTEALLAAMPRMDLPAHARLATIPGRPPDLTQPIAGCAFASRCHAPLPICATQLPAERTARGGTHRYACHNPALDDGPARQEEPA